MLILTTPQRRWDNLDATICVDHLASPSQEGKQGCGSAIYEVEPSFPTRFEVIKCATYDYNERLVHFLIYPKRAIEPALQSILNDINELSKEGDRDGYIFKPTPHARKSARGYIVEAYRKREGKFPRPRVVPDGKGGIIMEWKKDADVVKLGCVSADTKRDYIYYRQGNLYDVVEASVDVLLDHLAG